MTTRVRVLVNPITGYYANAERSTTSRTKVHVKQRGTHRPVCGANVDASSFQWCATRVEPEYIECASCRRILGLPKHQRPYQGQPVGTTPAVQLVGFDGQLLGPLEPGDRIHPIGQT